MADNFDNIVLHHHENLLVRFDATDLRKLDTTRLPSETGVHWASWVEHDAQDGHTYVHGVQDEDRQKFMHVARVKGDDLREPWEFWDGDGWSPRETDSAPVMDGVANEYSVSRLDANKYLLVTNDTHTYRSPDIVAYLGESRTGPWHEPTLLYRAPEFGASGQYKDANMIAYNSHEQPDLRRDPGSGQKELTITYNVNSLVPQDLTADTTKYLPRAINTIIEY